MPIPIIAAGIGAAIGAGGAAYASRQASKSAKSSAEAQRSYLDQSAAPARALEGAQLVDYNEIYRPQAQRERDIYLRYADQEAAMQNQLFATQSDLALKYLPGQAETSNRLFDEQARLALQYMGPQEELSNRLFREQGDIALRYMGPQAETANRLYEDQAKLQSDIYNPDTRALSARLMSDLDRPFGLPKDISDQLFQTSRRRISENYAPFREQAGQRLAGAGSLGTGLSEQVFRHLDDRQLQDLSDSAFSQAMAEFDIQRTGRQQSLENVYALLGLQRAPVNPGQSVSSPLVSPQVSSPLVSSGVPQTPSRAMAPTSTSAVGGTLPYLQQLYAPPIPKVGVNWGQVAQGAFSGAQMGAGFGGGFSPPVNYGAPGYHGAGYGNYPQLYQSQYGRGGF